MREILFKAKRADNGEWVEGAYSPNSCESPFGEMKPKPNIIKMGGRYDGFWFDVIPETVSQYTGLTDKNGKKIFEGDIFHLGDRNITYTVTWHDTGLQGKQNRSSSYVGLTYWGSRIEIIGNIHDRSGNSEPDN